MTRTPRRLIRLPPVPVTKRKLAALEALCGLGLPPQAFIPALLEALHELIPSARNLFDWAHEDGRLDHYFVEGEVCPVVARRYFEDFHNRREADCMPAFETLRTAPMGVRSARDLDHPAFFDSALYHEIWKPQGMHTRLEGIVRGRGGRLLGSLVLYRGPGAPTFTRDEECTLGFLLPAIGRALEAAGAQQPAAAGPEAAYAAQPRAVECVLLSPRCEALHATPGAHRLLLLAGDGLTMAGVADPVERLLERSFGNLMHQARRLSEAGRGFTPGAGPSGGRPAAAAPAASARRTNGYGRFDAVATPLWPLPAAGAAAEPMLQLTVRWAEAQRAAYARALRRLPVTAGQFLVCDALLRGLPQAAIAEELGVAPATVVDHVRKVYTALDIGSTQELRLRVERETAALH